MRVLRMHRKILYGLIFLCLSFLTACSGEFDMTPNVNASTRTYAIDTLFKEFYQTLGGQEILGPAIGPLEIRDTLQCQFLERALMCFDNNAIDASRFTLYPLGRDLKIEDPAQPVNAAAPGARMVDGYVIYEKFVPMYERLYGARYVGRPLTAVRINNDLQRIEQFFENVGFYQQMNDPNAPVYLIPYGAYLCGGDCAYKLDEYWSIVKSNVTDQPFAQSIARLGGPGVFGALLVKPQVTADGMLEQIYANAIFYAPQEDLSQVQLRPLPLMIGYEIQPLAAKIDHDQLVFYELENGMGHNVPRPFDMFVAMHGGMDLAGAPISEVILLPDQTTYQQCFTNYCLLYDPTAPEGMKVRMASLGQEYLNHHPVPQDAEIHDVFSAANIALTASVDKPNISSQEQQILRIMVRQVDNGQPLERVEAFLLVNIPGQHPTRYSLTPTDGSGMSSGVIPAQPGLTNGSRIAYQVCLNLPTESPICTADSYLIWNTQ